jgi:hypothetical protein
MGYKVLGETEILFQGYTKRQGLEGPFLKGCNRVVYYDAQEGKYWDPKTDFYLTNEEVAYLDNELVRMLAR